jgi:hypothetical protein
VSVFYPELVEGWFKKNIVGQSFIIPGHIKNKV